MSAHSLLSSSNSSENDQPDDMLFEIGDYLAASSDDLEEQFQLPQLTEERQRMKPSLLQADGVHVSESRITPYRKQLNVMSSSRGGSIKVAFKTKTEREVLDDGYKWRKYGKKMMKNSTNPRNYYRCSSEGCNVKKRVEREQEDSSYVITTYEGIHNHYVPSTTAARTST